MSHYIVHGLTTPGFYTQVRHHPPTSPGIVLLTHGWRAQAGRLHSHARHMQPTLMSSIIPTRSTTEMSAHLQCFHCSPALGRAPRDNTAANSLPAVTWKAVTHHLPTSFSRESRSTIVYHGNASQRPEAHTPRARTTLHGENHATISSRSQPDGSSSPTLKNLISPNLNTLHAVSPSRTLSSRTTGVGHIHYPAQERPRKTLCYFCISSL